MKIIAITGDSASGKTRLFRKLIGELKKRGYTVSVIKHCPQGFDLEPKGKEASQFAAAGAYAVCLYFSDGLAILQQKNADTDVRKISSAYLSRSDFILVEEGQSDKTLKKIVVLRKGISETISCPDEELMAVVSNFDIGTDVPVFHPEDIEKIADFLDNFPQEKEPLVKLNVNDVSVPLNPFVQKIFTNTILGLIRSLEGIPEEPGCITLSLKSGGKRDLSQVKE